MVPTANSYEFEMLERGLLILKKERKREKESEKERETSKC